MRQRCAVESNVDLCRECGTPCSLASSTDGSGTDLFFPISLGSSVNCSCLA